MGGGIVTTETTLEGTAVSEVAYDWYHNRMVTVSNGNVITLWEKGRGGDPLWLQRAKWQAISDVVTKVGIKCG
jgi:hypothetical protein